MVRQKNKSSVAAAIAADSTSEESEDSRSHTKGPRGAGSSQVVDKDLNETEMVAETSHESETSQNQIPHSSSGGTQKKKKKRARFESYSVFIYRVIKQVHPDMGISSNGMAILNSCVDDLFHRMANEAGNLTTYNKKSTISSREIQTVVRLMIPGELSKNSLLEGSKAINKYEASFATPKK